MGDDLSRFLDQAELEVQRRVADLRELNAVMDELVVSRAAARLSLEDVARMLGVDVSAVAEFEEEGADPTVTGLQRYARTVGLRVRVSLERDGQ